VPVLVEVLAEEDRLVAGSLEPDGQGVRRVELVVAAVRRCVAQTPWLCAYWPVRNVERDGQQSEYETKLLSKVTPWSAISVFTFGITRIDSTVWSSVSRTTTFGRTAASALDFPRPIRRARPPESIPADRAARRSNESSCHIGESSRKA
jgi:hypothetical protein